jgi:hypothetical protein
MRTRWYRCALGVLFAVGALRAAPAAADPAGDALGRRVAAAAGDPRFASELRFTFIVEVDGAARARRSYAWRPQAGALQIRWDGGQVAFQDLHRHDLSAAAKDPAAAVATWSAVAPGVPPADAAQAWAWWINDSYWLLAPSKVMDPGVLRSVDAEGRLVLQFDGVGLTPGDRYTMQVDPVTGLVTGWRFTLQDGRQGDFTWSDPSQVGLLRVATRKAAADGRFIVRFEDLQWVP